MASSPDSTFLKRAAELAERGRFRVEPNPLVGCVLVLRGRVVGEGWHAAWGGPHAEAGALRAAGRKARGATAYVTLEPCAHRGKRPPCSRALLRAGVTRVVYAHADPNPETAGRGPAELRAAGIAVHKARPPRLVTEQLAPYLAHLERGRPWVIAKWAMTLDGRIATRDRDSKWVTSERTRRTAHRLFRARVDAILAGAGTVLADDPSLTNRSGRGRQPLRVVACGRRPLPPRLNVLCDGGPTLLVLPSPAARNKRPQKGVETLVCGRSRRVDLPRLLGELHARGVRRLLVEGGGRILGSLFDAGLVDQVAVFLAPRIVGGAAAVAAVGGAGRARMADAWRLDRVAETAIGPDRLLEGYGHRSCCGSVRP